MWNKQKIHDLLDKSDLAVTKALLAIYARQTASEQASQTTKEANGVGFGAFDADFCSDIAQKVQRGWKLSPKQMAVIRNKMKRYHRQLLEIAMANQAAPTSSIIAAVSPEDADLEADEVRAELEEARLIEREILECEAYASYDMKTQETGTFA